MPAGPLLYQHMVGNEMPRLGGRRNQRNEAQAVEAMELQPLEPVPGQEEEQEQEIVQVQQEPGQMQVHVVEHEMPQRSYVSLFHVTVYVTVLLFVIVIFYLICIYHSFVNV
ncbi:hypothetical protein WA026_016582 [Henosepilachna vigintioctopunctata]|uniref:Uncharacterized protein n=1 Tax=Henosepilachna vigintioctopunctata TaxID=420089 RepID=A0AAW1VHD3_9CUCU